MLDPEKACLNCFNWLNEQRSICPYCGCDNSTVSNESHQLECGSILAGTYLVGKVLGQGGFGITYVGWDLNLNMKVAIKEYYPEGCVTRDTHTHVSVLAYAGAKETYFNNGKERFVEEARTLARFSGDSGIVGVRAFFYENGTAYIVMDFVEGETLKSYAARSGGKLSSAEVLSLFHPLIKSLVKVHDSNLLHRDISPDNIMIRPDGTLALLDFGAARQISAMGERSNTINVKHGYAPEEQYRTHGEQGPWTDVYALCATIYRLTTGATPTEALDRAMNENELVRPNQLGADFTPKQESAILHGLAVRANRRTQDMRELLAELYGLPNDNHVNPLEYSNERWRSNHEQKEKSNDEKSKLGTKEQITSSQLSTEKQQSLVKKPWPYIGMAIICGIITVFALLTKTRVPILEVVNTTDVIDVTAKPKESVFVNTTDDAVTATASPENSVLIDPKDPANSPDNTFTQLNVAMVTDGSNIDDKAYNETIWMGCKNWAKANSVVTNYYIPSEVSDESRTETIKKAIEKGANVIVCPGFNFGAICQQLPQQYPEVMFLGVDIGLGDVPEPQANTALITFQEEQSGFLAGYAAVMDGYTKLAFLGGIDVPAVVRYGFGFVQGANAAAAVLGNTKDVSIKYWYSGSFAPNDDIKSKTAGWYTEGTQIIFACGGGILYSAIASADEANGKLIGVDFEQSSFSERIVTSAKKELENSVSLALSDLLANGGKWSATYSGTENKLGAAQDCVGLPTDPDAWRFTSFTVDQYNTLLEKVKSGKYDIISAIDAHPTVAIEVDYQN